MNQERNAIFRENVKAAMRSLRRSKSEISAQLGFSEADKKWLSKIIRHGLDRPNARTMEKLGQLSKVLFGSDDVQLFWSSVPPPDAIESLDRMKALAGATKSAVGLATFIIHHTWDFSTEDIRKVERDINDLFGNLMELGKARHDEKAMAKIRSQQN